MSTDPYICIHMAAVCIVPMGEVLSHFINPRRLCEGYCSRSVCVSVSLSVNSLTATYFLFASLKHGVMRIFMLFQTHALCRFCWKRFVLQFWRHLLRTATFHHGSILPCTLAAFRWTRMNNSRLFSRYKISKGSEPVMKHVPIMS